MFFSCNSCFPRHGHIYGIFGFETFFCLFTLLSKSYIKIIFFLVHSILFIKLTNEFFPKESISNVYIQLHGVSEVDDRKKMLKLYVDFKMTKIDTFLACISLKPLEAPTKKFQRLTVI